MQEDSALTLARFILTSLCLTTLIAVYPPFELILTGAVVFGILFLCILMLMIVIFKIINR